MKHHSLTAVLWSITAVSDEEPETQVGEGGYEAKGGSEDDLGCDQVDSCGDTCPHRREGLRSDGEETGSPHYDHFLSGPGRGDEYAMGRPAAIALRAACNGIPDTG